MARCNSCDKLMLGGYKEGEQRFCSLPCYTRSDLRGFCADCVSQTDARSPGGTFTFNTFGTRMFFSRDRCPKCHSIVQTKAVCAFFAPVIPIAKYRVIYTGPSTYVGRRLVRASAISALKPTSAPQAGPAAAGAPESIRPK